MKTHQLDIELRNDLLQQIEKTCIQFRKIVWRAMGNLTFFESLPFIHRPTKTLVAGLIHYGLHQELTRLEDLFKSSPALLSAQEESIAKKMDALINIIQESADILNIINDPSLLSKEIRKDFEKKANRGIDIYNAYIDEQKKQPKQKESEEEILFIPHNLLTEPLLEVKGRGSINNYGASS